MKTSTNQLNGKLLLAFIVLFAGFSLNGYSYETDSCSHTGTVIDYHGGDSCGLLIQLDEGLTLTPVFIYPDFELRDSQRVKVGYELLHHIEPICYAGQPAAIYCIEEIESYTDSCYAWFSYTYEECLSPECLLNYDFFGHGSSDTAEWKWFINDIFVSEDQNFSHTFPSSGNYEICLKMITFSGCEAIYCEEIFIDTLMNCQAGFEYIISDTIVDSSSVYDSILEVHFIDYSYGNITEWFWSFGDSTYSSERNPLHYYSEPGEYQVCLTVTGDSGYCYSESCQWINVGNNEPCEADFEYCKYSFDPDTMVYDSLEYFDSIYTENYIIGFKNLSSPQDHNSYYYWDFGDGKYSFDKNPVHVYDYPGTYYVCLNITTGSGCHSEVCKTITVGTACDISFNYDIAVPNCYGYEIAHFFKPNLTGHPEYIFWDFGDGGYSYDTQPFYIFNDPGYKTVCVDVYYSDGCWANACQSIYVDQQVTDSVFMKKCGTSPIHDTPVMENLDVETIYPMPVKDNMTIEINSDIEQAISVELINMVGSSINLTTNYELNIGKNQLHFDVSGIDPGQYIYQVRTSETALRGILTIMLN